MYNSISPLYNSISPLYLSSLVPPLVQSTSNYSLRNADDIRTINARTSQYSDSFLPSTIREWSNLPSVDKNEDTVDAFKLHLNQGRVHVPKYFYTGSRDLQILYRRLRTGCSSLNLSITPKTSLILYCVVADVVTSKMQSISSVYVIYIVSTDRNYVNLFYSIVIFLLVYYSAGTSLFAMRPMRVCSQLYTHTRTHTHTHAYIY